MPILKDEYVGFRWHCLQCGCVSKRNYGTRGLAADAQVEHWNSGGCIPDHANGSPE